MTNQSLTEPTDNWLTTQQAAAAVGVSVGAIYRALHNGAIMSRRVSGRGGYIYEVSADDLHSYFGDPSAEQAPVPTAVPPRAAPDPAAVSTAAVPQIDALVQRVAALEQSVAQLRQGLRVVAQVLNAAGNLDAWRDDDQRTETR